MPNKFLPAFKFTPVLPPMELSIIARSVVGIWMIGMPRMNVEATSPAMSPTTPPPSAITHDDLSKSFSIISFERRSTVESVFERSPFGNEKSSALNPSLRIFQSNFPPYNFLTFESVIIAKEFAILSAFIFFGTVGAMLGFTEMLLTGIILMF